MNNSEFRVPSSEFRGRRSGAFTLIELLVVIAIIMILAGLLFAAANTARKRAHIARAKAEVRELAKAWKSYWITYGEWPVGYSGELQMDVSAMRILQADIARPVGTNPQKIKFMDIDDKKWDNGTGFTDPWGTPYRVDFSLNPNIGVDHYETTVFFPNRKRFEYE